MHKVLSIKNNHLAWLEISKLSLIHNVRQFRRIVGKKMKIMAVVKSNAYGHGMVECAKIFERAGCDWLGVANLDEALKLKSAGITKPVMVLSYFPTSLNQKANLAWAIKKGVRLAIYDLKTANYASRIALKARKWAYLHVKLDSGTSRLGALPTQILGLIAQLQKLPNIRIEGLFTHFADSENPDQAFTNKQLDVFERTIARLEEQGIDIPIKHAACSAATILNPASRFNMVRLGISLYGLYSIEPDGMVVQKQYPWFSLKPALSWYTRIIQLKEVAAGATIGYGLTYKTRKRTALAVLPVGYYEGYDRRLSNQADVLIHGRAAPVRGRVCMNITMVDVTGAPNAKVGDRVTLIGKDGKVEVTTDELAEKIGTINYEVVSRINPELPRLYI